MALKKVVKPMAVRQSSLISGPGGIRSSDSDEAHEDQNDHASFSDKIKIGDVRTRTQQRAYIQGRKRILSK